MPLGLASGAPLLLPLGQPGRWESRAEPRSRPRYWSDWVASRPDHVAAWLRRALRRLFLARRPPPRPSSLLLRVSAALLVLLLLFPLRFLCADWDYLLHEDDPEFLALHARAARPAPRRRAPGPRSTRGPSTVHSRAPKAGRVDGSEASGADHRGSTAARHSLNQLGDRADHERPRRGISTEPKKEWGKCQRGK